MKNLPPPATEPTHEEIARLAYKFFEEDGRREGHDVEHWSQALAHLCTDKEHTQSEKKRQP